MAVNLHAKYAPQIGKVFKEQSLVKGHLSNEYSFAGVRTVNVMTPETVPLNDYQRTGSNRYGTPQEMQDSVQELTLTRDRAFSLTVDKGNNQDQGGLKAAGKMLARQIKERVIPEYDAYVFKTLSLNGGTIVGSSTALSKTNVCDAISDGTLSLDDNEIPQDNRTLFVSNTVYKYLKHSDEFMAIDELGKEAVAKGQVGKYDNMRVIKVPAGRWPTHVNFMIVYKNSATAPEKLNDTKLHQDPPGISGNLLEGREYYDCFVLAPSCKGVYVHVNTASGHGTVLAAPTIAAAGGAISPPTGASVKYTIDGSDPRYSKSAASGTTVTGAKVGDTVKAYAFKDGAFPSPVAEQVLTSVS